VTRNATCCATGPGSGGKPGQCRLERRAVAALPPWPAGGASATGSLSFPGGTPGQPPGPLRVLDTVTVTIVLLVVVLRTQYYRDRRYRDSEARTRTCVY